MSIWKVILSLLGHKCNNERLLFYWNDKTSINLGKEIYQFKESKGRSVPIPLQRNIRGRPFWRMEGEASKGSSEITKADIIDGRFSIDLSRF